MLCSCHALLEACAKVQIGAKHALGHRWTTSNERSQIFCHLDQVQEEENLQEIHVEILYHEKPVSGKRLAMYYVVLTNQHPADGEW